jgi:endonuclease YncB( thermonuclease family)
VAAPTLPCLRGRLVVVGKSPDGDSIRFVPDAPARLRRLRRSWRLRTSSDGTVQLRLDAVDAPEVAFGPAPQPYAAEARAALLARCGFSGVRRGGDGSVTAAEPATRPAAVLSGLVDPNGRPVAFLLAGDTDLPDDGAYVSLDDALVDRTVNADLLRAGDAYATLYESTPEPVRERLRAIARDARERDAGLWPRDRTARFRIDDLGPDGDLVLPKLYRRAVEFLRDEDRDGRQTLRTWLATAEQAGRGRDDLVLVGAADEPVRLSSLVEQDGDEVRLTADPLDLTIVEA